MKSCINLRGVLSVQTRETWSSRMDWSPSPSSGKINFSLKMSARLLEEVWDTMEPHSSESFLERRSLISCSLFSFSSFWVKTAANSAGGSWLAASVGTLQQRKCCSVQDALLKQKTSWYVLLTLQFLRVFYRCKTKTHLAVLGMKAVLPGWWVEPWPPAPEFSLLWRVCSCIRFACRLMYFLLVMLLDWIDYFKYTGVELVELLFVLHFLQWIHCPFHLSFSSLKLWQTSCQHLMLCQIVPHRFKFYTLLVVIKASFYHIKEIVCYYEQAENRRPQYHIMFSCFSSVDSTACRVDQSRPVWSSLLVCTAAGNCNTA